MTSTLITLTAGFGVALMVAGIFEINRQKSRRRDREVLRRLFRYMDSLPPARPW